MVRTSRIYLTLPYKTSSCLPPSRQQAAHLTSKLTQHPPENSKTVRQWASTATLWPFKGSSLAVSIFTICAFWMSLLFCVCKANVEISPHCTHGDINITLGCSLTWQWNVLIFDSVWCLSCNKYIFNLPRPHWSQDCSQYLPHIVENAK